MTSIRMQAVRRLAATLAAALLGNAALAHDGGHDDAPAEVAGGAGAPRLEAHSDLFELVGVVEHGAMILYLDRHADNEPVTNASIEVESGTQKGVASANADGSYTFAYRMPATPGPASFTFTVMAGKDADLLAGDLVVPGAAAEHAHGAWLDRVRATWIAAALAVFAAALAAGQAWRRRRVRKQGISK